MPGFPKSVARACRVSHVTVISTTPPSSTMWNQSDTILGERHLMSHHFPIFYNLLGTKVLWTLLLRFRPLLPHLSLARWSVWRKLGFWSPPLKAGQEPPPSSSNITCLGSLNGPFIPLNFFPIYLKPLSSNSSLAVSLSLQSIIMIFPMNSLSWLQTSSSVVLWNGVIFGYGISCMRYRIAVIVSELAISSYFDGNGPKYWNCRLSTSNPYSSWPYGTARGRKRLKLPP